MGRGDSWTWRPCRCEACAAFNPPWNRREAGGGFGQCGVCGGEGKYRQLVSFVPEIVAEFLGTRNVCWCCRNTINHAVQKDLKLCWGTTPDELLKWALAFWVVNSYFAHHFRFVFHERECCRAGFHERRVRAKRAA